MPFKPDPFIITKILKDQSWLAPETLMVGDTDNDILAGKRAGVSTCGVTYGSLSRQQIQALHPDSTIDSLRELLQLL
jgi:phosphoglycolate phosphatase